MKVAIFSLLLTVTAVADATDCDVDVFTKLSETSHALQCKDVSNFAVPVESTSNTVITDLGYFCANGACLRLLKTLGGINECSIDGSGLHTVVVGPIDAQCSTTRTLRAADGSHVHSSGMDMGSASAETGDSHEVTSPTTSSEAEDSHDTTSASSRAEDLHDVAASASASAAAGDDDDGDSTLLVARPPASPPAPAQLLVARRRKATRLRAHRRQALRERRQQHRSRSLLDRFSSLQLQLSSERKSAICTVTRPTCT